MKVLSRTVTLILLGIFFTGVCVLLYPSISQYWNSRTETKAVADYDQLQKEQLSKDYSSWFQEAYAYNEKLAGLTHPISQFQQVTGYEDTLNVTGTGMMGYISIDKLRLELPIYHGTSAEVLNRACGHLQGSSLPVGGAGTHCVLTAHRGLPSAKLFTDLGKMEIGDTFIVTVLNQRLFYQVDQIKVVTPEELNDLTIEEGHDYCTLVTCTPYGINTHRLLVRGSRIEGAGKRLVYTATEAAVIDRMIVASVVALPILLMLILIVFFKPARKRPFRGGDDGYEDFL